MIAEAGNLALALALAFALLQATLPLVGARRGREAWMALAPRAAIAQALLVVAALACLAACFLESDFSVQLVAKHSNSRLPAFYRFAATWGSHEGSMLLWAAMLGGWTAAAAFALRGQAPERRARVLAALGWICAGMLAFMLSTANPFARLFPAALEGRDLNPLLQDPGMVLHPPVLYLGYSGFAVAWAIAIAGLRGPARPDELTGGQAGYIADARAMRRWCAAAWACLTTGIALGSWWAYRELGWGGWWFWDPVENASLMPWLTGTALLHALSPTATGRAGMRAWATGLAVLTFALSLLGTFLMRSGVLTSVHAFATDPARGVFILSLVAAVVVASVGLVALAPPVRTFAAGPMRARESLLLANTLVLVAVCASVLLGTLYPLAMETLGIGHLSVGPPYFESVLLPCFLALALLAGWGPLVPPAIGWGKAVVAARASAAVAVVAGIGAAALVPAGSLLAGLGLGSACWLVVSSVRALSRASGQRPWPMALAHLGLAVFIAGATVSRGLGEERDVRLATGESATLAEHVFRLEGVAPVQGPNYDAMVARVVVIRAGVVIATLLPEKRIYRTQPGTPMSEAAIDAGTLRDLYVTLGEAVPGPAWTLKLQVKPLVRWIWAGCLLMALGGLASAFAPLLIRIKDSIRIRR